MKSDLWKEDLVTRLTEIGFFLFLAEQKLPSDPAMMTRKKMWDLWKENRDFFQYYAVEELAKAAGHTVLRRPPYHCIFNPIELLWAYQKGVARSGDGIERSVAQATQTCQEAFSQILHEDLRRYFDQAIGEEDKYRTAVTDFQHSPVIITYNPHESSESDEGATPKDYWSAV